jgi:hypothetical protein
VYIRAQGDGYILVKTVKGPDGKPEEIHLADLGEDPELNLYFVVSEGRRKDPDLWKDIHDYHALQALEIFKRRTSGYKAPLAPVNGGKESVDKKNDG